MGVSGFHHHFKAVTMTKALLLLIVSATLSMYVQAQSGETIYQMHCAGCHGGQLQGTTAGSTLVKSEWAYGSDRASILNNIRHGIASTTMVAWSDTLSDGEIEAVADFILQARVSFEETTSDEDLLIVETEDYALEVEKVITEGLDGPWAIDFVDENLAYITGYQGELYRVADGKLDDQSITGLPQTYAYDAAGGMMGLAVDPDYSDNGWIYIALSHNPDNSMDSTAPGMTKVVRGKISGHEWVEEQTLFQVHDSLLVSGGTRWGSRVIFDGQGYLYFTIGDMERSIQESNNPQILTRPEGKIYRIRPDGSIPEGNPLYGRHDVLQAIYAWGTRNVQGLAQHPETGDIYFTDHGPQGGDELNILWNGANYGWPVITYGVNYDGSTITDQTRKEGMEQPITYWTPSIAVSATAFVTGDRFPAWQNDLLVTALRAEEVRRLVVEEGRVVKQEILLKGHGRVRDIAMGPDGAIYVLTNAPDELLRITPQ